MEPVTDISISYILMDAATLATLTYYSVKHINHHNVYNSIFENLDYVDDCLQSIDDYRLHTVTLKIVCNLYTVITISVHIYIAYDYFQLIATLKYHETLDVYTTYSVVIRWSFHVFTAMHSVRLL